MEMLLNILHVLTSVFIIGPMAILPMTGLRALRTGNGAQVDAMAKSTLIFTLLSLLVVLFGFGVLGTSDPKFNLSVGTPWVVISITLYVLAFILNLALVWPALRRAARRMLPAEPTGAVETPVASNSDYTLISMGSGIVSILLVVIVILMVWKP